MISDKLAVDFMQNTIAALAPNPHAIPVAMVLALAWADAYQKIWRTAAAVTSGTTPPAPRQN